jgi:hypothetical protein
MIITHTQNQLHRSDQFAAQACTIEAEDMRYIAKLLRNNYSDTILATIREIVANAIDVSDSGIKPQVTLPTKIKPDFCVRDFGHGLSEEEMFGLYTKYGKSTKRGTNSAIGGFGIGRFAPLSYTTSFMVTSIHASQNTYYSIFFDENDDTVVTKLWSEKSSEPQGLFVQVPIAFADVSRFHKVFSEFSIYLQDKLEILGEFSPIELGKTVENEVFDLIGYKGEFEKCASNRYRSASSFCEGSVLMGGVRYPVKRNDRWDNFNNGMVFKAEIGQFDLHHGREQLEYSPRTEKALMEANEKIASTMSAYCEAELGKAKNYYERSKIGCKIRNIFNFYFNISRSMSKICEKYTELPIFESSWLQESGSFRANLSGLANPVRLSRLRRYNLDLFPRENDNCIFVVDDKPSPQAIQSRLFGLISQREKEDAEKNGRTPRLNTHCEFIVYLLKINEQFKAEAFKRVADCQSRNVLFLSQVERTSFASLSVKQNGDSAKKVSNLSSADILVFNHKKGNYREADYWSPMQESIDPQKTYYYVRYKANKPCTLNGDCITSIFNYQEFIPNKYQNFPKVLDFFAGCVQDINHYSGNKIEVLGVRSNVLDKVAKMPNFVSLESYCDSVFAKSKEAVNAAKWHLLYKDNRKVNYWSSNSASDLVKILRGVGSIPNVPELESFIKHFLAVAQKEYHSPAFLPKSFLASTDIAKEKKAFAEFISYYPLFAFFDRLHFWEKDSELYSSIRHYLHNTARTR